MQREKRIPWEKEADCHDLRADEICSQSTIRYKPTVRWQRACSPFDHSPVSMETHWGLKRYQVFEKLISNLAHRPLMEVEVGFHPSSPGPGPALPFNEAWVVRFQQPPSTFSLPRHQALLSFRKASMLPSHQNEKETGQDRYQVPQRTRSSCQAIQHRAVQIHGKSRKAVLSFIYHWHWHTSLFSLAASQIPAELCRWMTLQQQPMAQYDQVVSKPKIVAVLSGEDWKLLT